MNTAATNAATSTTIHNQMNLKSTIAKPHVMLKRFIVDRVLGDPELAAKYTKGSIRNFESKYKAELRKVSHLFLSSEALT